MGGGGGTQHEGALINKGKHKGTVLTPKRLRGTNRERENYPDPGDKNCDYQPRSPSEEKVGRRKRGGTKLTVRDSSALLQRLMLPHRR